MNKARPELSGFIDAHRERVAVVALAVSTLIGGMGGIGEEFKRQGYSVPTSIEEIQASVHGDYREKIGGLAVAGLLGAGIGLIAGTAIEARLLRRKPETASYSTRSLD